MSNNKAPNRKGKVQLINAVSFYQKMKSSLGNKRNEISDAQIAEISKIFEDFKAGEYSKIFDNTDFGYTRITVERPLKRNFQASKERLERLQEESAFIKIANSKPKPKEPTQKDVLSVLGKMPTKLYKDYEEFAKWFATYSDSRAARRCRRNLRGPTERDHRDEAQCQSHPKPNPE